MIENVARQFADKGTAAAEEAKKGMEQAYETASKGAVDFNLRLIDMAQANTKAAFDFARQLTSAKSPSEFFELLTSHVRKQRETLSEQVQQITTLTQKAAIDAAQPFQASGAKIFNQRS